ncbi:hypothetical protein [Kiritimatiella glycovorans]|uniref:Uncharacterized protein n=1 Tax=Kiritimatiella glycovorans TaxID=1307763 RepID=A0A0G3EDS3_9BACT|nr:hypothetical protein [Kiritimatiella glycovorans]AKJ63557.1 hypothetical protein L21SP4_00276 [Kiritimatiella glycovorans]
MNAGLRGNVIVIGSGCAVLLLTCAFLPPREGQHDPEAHLEWREKKIEDFSYRREHEETLLREQREKKLDQLSRPPWNASASAARNGGGPRSPQTAEDAGNGSSARGWRIMALLAGLAAIIAGGLRWMRARRHGGKAA